MEAATWVPSMVARCGHSWLNTHSVFRMALGLQEEEHEHYTWTNTGRNRVENKGFFVCDPDMRGFLFIVDRDDYNELYFALVDEPHRRQGVLRGLVQRLDQNIPLWLECTRDVAEVWKSMGFTLTKKQGRGSSCDYEFKRKPTKHKPTKRKRKDASM